MEKSDLTSLVNHLCHVQRQQFLATQELVLAIAALQNLMADYGHPNFREEHHAKIRDLRDGELGQQLAHDTAAFEQAIQGTKASLLS